MKGREKLKTILVKDTSRTDNWRKEFYCHGAKNAEEVCSDCTHRYECFTSDEALVINLKDLNLKNGNNLSAEIVANYLTPTIKVSIREDTSRNKKVQINFNKVRKFI